MSGASTAAILAAFAAAGLGMWFVPSLLDLLGLGVFAFVGRVCAVVIALSCLEAAFARLAPSSHET